MRNEIWEQDREREVYEEGPVGSTYLRVNGMNHDVEIGSSFRNTVLAMAKDAGLGKFRVFVGGEEIGKSEAPETFVEGMQVELRPYDIAG